MRIKLLILGVSVFISGLILAQAESDTINQKDDKTINQINSENFTTRPPGTPGKKRI